MNLTNGASNAPDYECDSCKGTGIFGAKTCVDVWEPCPEEHEIEEEA